MWVSYIFSYSYCLFSQDPVVRRKGEGGVLSRRLRGVGLGGGGVGCHDLPSGTSPGKSCSLPLDRRLRNVRRR